MKQNRFLGYFTQKLKLSARRVSTSKEVWHVFISRGRLILLSTFIVLVLGAGLFFAIAYTPGLLDKMPGYISKQSREEVISSMLKLDSLKQEVQHWQRYTSDINAILDGKKIESIITENDSIRGKIKSEITPTSIEDSLLRSSIESSVNNQNSRRRSAEHSFAMIAPVEGSIVPDLSSRANLKGIVLNPKPGAVVMSVLDGTVIFSDWTPSDGYVVVVQHAASMISVYKKMEQVLKIQGARVKAGEGVGITQSNKGSIIPEFIFELWSEGNAVDPESYITFSAPESSTIEVAE